MPLNSTQKKKLKNGKCVVKFCRRNHKKESKYCRHHLYLREIEVNPEKVAYNNLKGNAKRRGKEFSLTFDEFLYFLKLNPDHMIKKGKGLKSLQIDRINNNEGYKLSNIRSITMKENLRKYHDHDKHEGVPF